MIRYIAIRPRPRADWADDHEMPLLAQREVFVSDDAPVSTGLVDSNGTPLYRTVSKIKIGFIP